MLDPDRLAAAPCAAALVVLALVSLVAGVPGRALAQSEADPAADAESDPPTNIAVEDLPVGVQGAQLLRGGQIMVAYRYEREFASGLRTGTKRESVPTAQARGFRFAPYRMDLQTYEIEVLWAPNDRFTLSAALPLHRLDGTYRDENGRSFDLSAKGVGDLRLVSRVLFMRKGNESLSFELGLEAPTGSIDQKERTPAGTERVPYRLRVGSGTWNFMPAATYMGFHGPWSWGVRASGQFFLSDTDERYNHGDAWQVGGWISRRWLDRVSTSFRLAWMEQENINGFDRRLDQTLSPDNRHNTHRYARLDLSPGLSIGIPELGGQRLSFEASWPVYQSLSGPQVETDWTLRAGWRWAF